MKIEWQISLIYCDGICLLLYVVFLCNCWILKHLLDKLRVYFVDPIFLMGGGATPKMVGVRCPGCLRQDLASGPLLNIGQPFCPFPWPNSCYEPRWQHGIRLLFWLFFLLQNFNVLQNNSKIHFCLPIKADKWFPRTATSIFFSFHLQCISQDVYTS